MAKKENNVPDSGHNDPLDVLSPLPERDEFCDQTPDSLPAAEEQDRVSREGLQGHRDDCDQNLGPAKEKGKSFSLQSCKKKSRDYKAIFIHKINILMSIASWALLVEANYLIRYIGKIYGDQNLGPSKQKGRGYKVLIFFLVTMKRYLSINIDEYCVICHAAYRVHY